MYGQKYGSEGAAQRLKSHWDTFITEESFAQIKAANLNTVRIPIGYWGIPGIANSSEPFATGQYPYLLKAVGWAKKYDLSVVLDIHGVPGSQNSFGTQSLPLPFIPYLLTMCLVLLTDNSGREGEVRWYKSQYDVDKSMAALEYLINDFVVKPEYRDTGAYLSILLNDVDSYQAAN